jgi:hypothetical protein
MRKLKESNEAVAGVIGAILIMGVITITITMITVYYVPVWIEGNEANHMRQLSNEISSLKSMVDMQIQKGDRNTTMYSRITLGNEGLPFFDVAKTSGTLAINSFDNAINLRNSSSDINFTGFGNIKITPSNRYYTQQSYIYENGALILHQPDGGLATSSPQLTINNKTGNVTVAATLVSINGIKSTLSSTGTMEVQTKLLVSWEHVYDWNAGVGNNITLNITTEFPNIWKTWFDTELNKTENNLIWNKDFTITNSGNAVNIVIFGVKTLNLKFVVIDTKIA